MHIRIKMFITNNDSNPKVHLAEVKHKKQNIIKYYLCCFIGTKVKNNNIYKSYHIISPLQILLFYKYYCIILKLC